MQHKEWQGEYVASLELGSFVKDVALIAWDLTGEHVPSPLGCCPGGIAASRAGDRTCRRDVVDDCGGMRERVLQEQETD